MDFDKISLWLFLLISSIYNSECKSFKKYQIPNNGGMDADDNCFCFKSPGNHKKVPEILSPNENSLERLVVYLYKDKFTNQVKLYVPNKEKQDHVPDLAFEVGDRLLTVEDEKVKDIFNINSRNTNIAPDSGNNEESTEIKKPDYLEIEDPENELPHITPQNSDESSADNNDNINNQYFENLPQSDPSSLEQNNLPFAEDLPPKNLDFDKSAYHMYDVPGSVPNYHEFYHEQDEKPTNNVIKIISQEINIPNKMIYDGVYHEPQSDYPNHDIHYDPSHAVIDQVMTHESKDLDGYIYDPKLVLDINNQIISHDIKDPGSSIYGQYDPNLIHIADSSKFIYEGDEQEPNNRPLYINDNTPYSTSENIIPSQSDDNNMSVNDKPDFNDWDTQEIVDKDAETNIPNQEQETKNSSPTQSQSIEESAKDEPNENSSSSPSQPISEDTVKNESVEDVKSNDEPNSSAGQSNTEEIKENKRDNESLNIESPSIESPSIEVDNSEPKNDITCNGYTCTTEKSSTVDHFSTEIKSNEENYEPTEENIDGNDTDVNITKNNSNESEHEIKINDNHYETFDRWFIQQMDRFRSYTEHDRAVNLLTIERYILKILHDNGMFVTSEGVLTDSYGTALDVNNLHLRPILIGNTMAFGSILNAKGTDLVMPANMAYLQAILVTNANPSMILGIIPIGKTVIPPSAVNAFSTILTPHVHNNDQVTHHSRISNNHPKHYFETTKVNIKHVPGRAKSKPIVLHLSKHMPSTVRTLGKKKGKTVITVVKKRPIIVHSHHRLRQPPKVQVYGIGNGMSKFLTGDSADAVNKLLIALREGSDPMKSAEATNKLLASLRKNANSLDLTPENSNESSSDYSDDDIAGRIVGGSAATGSGAPLSAKGRIKDF